MVRDRHFDSFFLHQQQKQLTPGKTKLLIDANVACSGGQSYFILRLPTMLIAKSAVQEKRESESDRLFLSLSIFISYKCDLTGREADDEVKEAEKIKKTVRTKVSKESKATIRWVEVATLQGSTCSLPTHRQEYNRTLTSC